MSFLIVGPPEGVAPRLDVPLLRRRGSSVLRAVGRGRDELTLSLVRDNEIRELNRDYRGKRRATDVLSFSLLEGEDTSHRGKLLGDVVISIDTARRQARHRRPRPPKRPTPNDRGRRPC